MALLTGRTEPGPPVPTTVAGATFVAIVVAVATHAESLPVAIWALAFWHYGLYVLAYTFGAVSAPVFRRDAVLAKAASLATLATAYIGASPDPWSMIAVVAGLSLNAWAARVLGAERTYYGAELADLPALRVTRLPYSAIAHPMLIGNVIAYTGLLLDPAFRRDWWPLALAHVGFNVGLLMMELRVRPRRGYRRAGPSRAAPLFVPLTLALAVGAGAGAAASVGQWWPLGPIAGSLLGASLFGHATVLYAGYVWPSAQRGTGPADRTEDGS